MKSRLGLSIYSIFLRIPFQHHINQTHKNQESTDNAAQAEINNTVIRIQ